MSTQQDIYAAGFENCHPMLNKENYVPWSSRLLHYAKSRPNGKLIYNSIINGPYARQMIPKPGDADREVSVNETFHEQTNDELTDKELKQEVDDLRAKRLAKTQDPLALMTISNNPFNYLVFHPDQPSSSTYMQQPQPNNNYNPQPSFNQNYMQQSMPNLKDITDPKTSMDMALVLMAKAFKLNYSIPTNNNHRISSNPRNRQITQPGNHNRYNVAQNVQNQVVQNAVKNPGVQNVGNHNDLIVDPGIANQNLNKNGNVVVARAEGNANGNNGNQIRCYNCRGLGHLARNCTVMPRRRDATYLQTQMLIAQKEEAGIHLQAVEFDLMATAADLDEIEEVNAVGARS
nr:hypothetical protein [Tanacetum cinerariifolium]